MYSIERSLTICQSNGVDIRYSIVTIEYLTLTLIGSLGLSIERSIADSLYRKGQKSVAMEAVMKWRSLI